MPVLPSTDMYALAKFSTPETPLKYDFIKVYGFLRTQDTGTFYEGGGYIQAYSHARVLIYIQATPPMQNFAQL